MNLTWDPVLLLLQMLPFLVTLVALHFILFRPMLAYLDARDEAIEGVKREAKEMQDKVEADRTEWERRITAARRDAGLHRARLHDEAETQRNRLLATSRKESDVRVGQAISEIVAARESARSGIRGFAAQLATEIAHRVLGRPTAEA